LEKKENDGVLTEINASLANYSATSTEFQQATSNSASAGDPDHEI
jgi:hypothetical protein